jgi:hypothetical protein
MAHPENFEDGHSSVMRRKGMADAIKTRNLNLFKKSLA